MIVVTGSIWIFFVISLAFDFFIGFFVHIYIFLKTVPSCNSEEANISKMCFNGFTRWLAIVAQGAALGLLVDVHIISVFYMEITEFFLGHSVGMAEGNS
jgi:hypothetical protein